MSFTSLSSLPLPRPEQTPQPEMGRLFSRLVPSLKWVRHNCCQDLGPQMQPRAWPKGAQAPAQELGVLQRKSWSCLDTPLGHYSRKQRVTSNSDPAGGSGKYPSVPTLTVQRISPPQVSDLRPAYHTALGCTSPFSWSPGQTPNPPGRARARVGQWDPLPDPAGAGNLPRQSRHIFCNNWGALFSALQAIGV